MLEKILKHPTIFSFREIRGEIWRSLPIWFFYIEAIGVLHFMMANVDPAQYAKLGYKPWHFAIMVLLPLSWVIGYYLIRIAKSERLLEKGYFSIVIPVLLLVPPAFIFLLYSAFPGLRVIISEQNLRVVFEYAQLCWIALFIVYAFKFAGFQKFVTFYVVGFVYGLLLENAGIVLGYFYEPHYLYYLWRLPAPFATMMGWCLIFFCCIWVTRFVGEHVPFFKKTPMRSALLTTSIALSLDFQVDPLASLSGVFWRWNDLLPTWFLSVPFCNFAAWFGAFLPFSWAYFYLLDRADLTESQRNWKLFVHVPLIAAVAGLIWLTIMTIWEGGFSGPTYQILDAFLDRIMPYPTN